MFSLLRAPVVLVAALSSIAYAVHPVEIRGQQFVDTVTNKRVMLIGVDYQPGGQAGYKPQTKQDALTDADVCLRDAALLQRLGINVIRVYNVDPQLDHSKCMNIFNAAGFYVIIDVNSPFESIHREDPIPSYTPEYIGRVFGVAENFAPFNNTLAFFSANEVMNDVETGKSANPKVIRAVQRDLKNYISKRNADTRQKMRKIPVGYSAADVREILKDTWNYFQCDHDDDASTSDFFGLNSYSWCGNGDAKTSGYNDMAAMFKESSIPVFMSEFGCNEVENRAVNGRPFTEIQAIYGKDMTMLSGGLVYEYSQEESDYGLVDINPDGTVKLRPDFNKLQDQYNKLDLTLLQSSDASTTKFKAPSCSDKNLITSGTFSTDFELPKVNATTQSMINDGVKKFNVYAIGQPAAWTETKVKQKVYDTQSKEIALSLKILSNEESNLPNGQKTTGTGSGSATSPSPKPGAASTLSGKTGWALAAISFAVGLTML